MKCIAAIVFSCICTCSIAQKIERFYDFNWKETTVEKARYYSMIVSKDSSWQREDYYWPEGTMQMKGLFTDTTCKVKEGAFAYYHPNRRLKSTGTYKNNKQEGLWLYYFNDGTLSDSMHYSAGKKIGISLGWYKNGYMRDSSFFNKDESGIEIGWFDEGTPFSAGAYAAGRKKQGKWKYFHANGQISCLETFETGKLLDKKYFAEDGTAIDDTASRDRQADFQGGEKAWRKFLEKNLNPNVPVINRSPLGYYTVHIQFTINTDGTISDIEPLTVLGFGMENEVIRLLKKVAKWEPAIDHGRKIKAYRIQPVTFVVSN